MRSRATPRPSRCACAPGCAALAEAEGIVGEGGYNSGANGRSDHPVVADPAGAELNQLWLGWHGERVKATAGRQRVLLDNQRWVGNSGWRQNEQTFDAVSWEWSPTVAITARYTWFDRVHRVSGDDARDPLARERDLDSHVIDLAFMPGDQQVGGYVLAHEDRDAPAASTVTAGFRWSGQHLLETPGDVHGWGWRLEAARQRDHANNPLDFAHSYWLLEPKLVRRGVTWRAGWEHLGGDGRHALQTPLATLHAFNGWADKFGVTPAGGLDDRYLSAAGTLGRGTRAGKFSWAAAWHDYRADTGAAYGREWNASLGFPLGDQANGLVKLADYRSDGFARDTTKLWLQLEWVQP